MQTIHLTLVMSAFVLSCVGAKAQNTFTVTAQMEETSRTVIEDEKTKVVLTVLKGRAYVSSPEWNQGRYSFEYRCISDEVLCELTVIKNGIVLHPKLYFDQLDNVFVSQRPSPKEVHRTYDGCDDCEDEYEQLEDRVLQGISDWMGHFKCLDSYDKSHWD